MKKHIVPFIILICSLVFYSGCSSKTNTVSFTADVFPLFTRSCGVCHRREGGNPNAATTLVFFETEKDILSKSTEDIRPGKPEESSLVRIVSRVQKVGENNILMPPPDSGVNEWTEEEILLFAKWIKEGAKEN